MTANTQQIVGFSRLRGAGAASNLRYDRGTNKDGPERGVGTSGRGLIDATEERQL